MIAIYIILIIIILIILSIVFPIRIKIHYNESEKKELKIVNKIEIYIFKIIKVKSIEIKSKNKIEKKKSNYKVNAIYKLINNYVEYIKKEKKIMSKKEFSKIFKSIYYEKMDFDIGINLNNPIINAYIIALSNIFINMFIIKNEKRINLTNMNYSTYISNNIFNLRINAIIRVKLVNIIVVIAKIVMRVMKIKRKEKNKYKEMNEFSEKVKA